MSTLSSLELMLEKLQQSTDYNAENLPPALPARPVSKARLPTGKKSWPVKLQDIDANENNVEDDSAKTLNDRRIIREDDLGSRENRDVEELVTVALSVEEEVNGKCCFGDNGGCVTQKIDMIDNTREKAESELLGIQIYFRGNQAFCLQHELIEGIITLQSFVRAENARNRMNTANRTLQARHRAVLLLQSVTRGWLSRRHLKFNENNDRRSQELKDFVRVPVYEVLELQRRVLKTEAAAQQKKDENNSLRQKIALYEKQWQQHEAKMKSMEKMWQEQLTYIQVSLAEVARESNASEENANEIIMVDSAPLPHNADAWNHTTSRHERLSSVGELDLDINPEDELQNLKLRFDIWKKDYKSQIHKTKATFQKLGTSKVKKSSKKWWER